MKAKYQLATVGGLTCQRKAKRLSASAKICENNGEKLAA
jgi:hypothetical protein